MNPQQSFLPALSTLHLMFISEIFYSIQGEGELAGVPSVFIRTSGCNLRCNWCDTPYTSWQAEGEHLSIAQIMATARAYPARHVVLTGGEPMIAPEIKVLAEHLKTAGYHITIETAGTVAPAGIVCDLASLSPKLRNSEPDHRLSEKWRQQHHERRWQPTVWRDWLQNYAYQLKFVVAAAADILEIQNLLQQLDMPVAAGKVLLMPEGVTSEILRERAGWLVEVCKQHGYRYCPRLHVELFGNKRGT